MTTTEERIDLLLKFLKSDLFEKEIDNYFKMSSNPTPNLIQYIINIHRSLFLEELCGKEKN